MNELRRAIRLGTRGSALARRQTDHVADLLRHAWPQADIQIQVMTTQGDRDLTTPLPLIGGKGLFTAELETALRDGLIDLAVHSLKDLPTETPPGLMVGAICARANPRDVLVSRGGLTLQTLPQGAVVGTCSRRRAAQLLALRPDLRPLDIRGNVDSRIRKALEAESVYDGILLAAAGLERLGQMRVVSEILSPEVMLPAPGQGALAVQCRDEAESRALLMPINHTASEMAVTAERAFLAGLGGGCALPIAAYGLVEGDKLRLCGRILAPDGRQQVDVQDESAANLDAARQLGESLARQALGKGAARLLETPA